MWDPQREWWVLPNKIKAFVGGYGSGKTLLICKWVISMALENAPVPMALVSPSFAQAKKTTIPTIRALLAGKQTLYGPRAFYWRYNKQDHYFRIKFHGREALILILSGDDPDALRGSNLAGCGIDEPFIQKQDVWSQMIARVRHPDAPRLGMALAGTPEQLNWGYDLCVGELGADLDVGLVQVSTLSNKALPKDYVPSLLSTYDEKTAEAYVSGQFVNLSKGQVYYAFSHKDCISDLPVEVVPEYSKTIGGCLMPAGAELGVGMDFNVDPMAFTIFWKYKDHIHFFDEFELPNCDTEFACQLLRERYWADGLRDIYPDPAGRQRHSNAPGGRTDYHYIQEAGFRIHSRPPGLPRRKDRYNAVNAKLKPRGSRPTLTIARKCKQLAKYMSIYTHELMNSKEQKAFSHLLDAFSYPVEYLFPAVKPRIANPRVLS